MIKPIPENVTDFYSWLEKSGKYSHVLEYLNDRDRRSDKPTRFPQNQTVELDYDQDLMFSYYLLGKYIAEHALSTKLRAWLNDPSECQGS